MSESTVIIQALKQLLRTQKITYANVADHLQLSEASVKRLFSQGSFTLERLEQVCDLAGVRICDLTRMAENRPGAISRLTEEQEDMLVKDVKLLLTAMLTLNHWTIKDITDTYAMNEQEVIGKLLQLDRIGMIELQPGNRVKHLVARHFAWRPDGPVQRYFESKKVKHDFLDSRFEGPGEHLRFLGGMLSRDSITRMHAAIDQLLKDLDAHIQQDANLPIDEKWGIGAIFAIRPWEFPPFRELHVKEHKPLD